MRRKNYKCFRGFNAEYTSFILPSLANISVCIGQVYNPFNKLKRFGVDFLSIPFVDYSVNIPNSLYYGSIP